MGFADRSIRGIFVLGVEIICRRTMSEEQKLETVISEDASPNANELRRLFQPRFSNSEPNSSSDACPVRLLDYLAFASLGSCSSLGIVSTPRCTTRGSARACLRMLLSKQSLPSRSSGIVALHKKGITGRRTSD